jgi:hypothetical protein
LAGWNSDSADHPDPAVTLNNRRPIEKIPRRVRGILFEQWRDRRKRLVAGRETQGRLAALEAAFGVLEESNWIALGCGCGPS